MRELPHVTVAGEPTMGATGNPEWHDLGGGWSYTVSIWRCITADGLEIEDRGIPPDVEVAATPADFAAGRDPVLEYAERWAAARQP
jgi:C-terminal processing protease CtpA/Prc